MKKYFLDSSFIIDLINEKEEALELHQQIRGKEVTGTINLYELLKFSDITKFLLGKELVPLKKEDAIEASRIYRDLKKKGKLIADIDILIGGIVANRSYTLVTRDEDFKKIKDVNLKLY